MKQLLQKHKMFTWIVCLVLALSVGFAAERIYAYFTTYATAQGTVPISLGSQTDIHEEYANWKKTISVENTGEVPVFVRVKVLCASQFEVTAEGTNWSLGNDGYYYYSEVVLVGETTENIVASIQKSEDVKSDFNIIVVQECTPVMYDENGNPHTAENADWAMSAKYSIDENGNTTIENEEADDE
ncbi:MAG: hypothetical protein E7282_10570 [Lachnospiraceae bacterium]|nr:hypothetical protein [Lachnospiraceae bacterium]